MDVQIDELTSRTDVLNRDLLKEVIAAVKAELAREASLKDTRNQDTDPRSIVEQQRGGAK
jgi:hypothetical protein